MQLARTASTRRIVHVAYLKSKKKRKKRTKRKKEKKKKPPVLVHISDKPHNTHTAHTYNAYTANNSTQQRRGFSSPLLFYVTHPACYVLNNLLTPIINLLKPYFSFYVTYPAGARQNSALRMSSM